MSYYNKTFYTAGRVYCIGAVLQSAEDLFLAVPMTEVNIICRFPCRVRMRWEARR